MIGSEAGGTRERAFTLMESLVVIVILAALATLVVSNVDRTREDAEKMAPHIVMQTLAEALTGSPAGPGYLADMKRVPGFPLVDIQIANLLAKGDQPGFDPVASRGWRGPYLRNTQAVANTNPDRHGHFPASDERRFSGDGTFFERGFFADGASSPYGTTGDPAVGDLWGNPIVIQVPSQTTSTPTAALRLRYARLVSAGPDGELTTPLDRLAGMLSDGTASVRGDDLVLFLNRSDIYEP